jgi:hypothetical protein
MLTRLQNLMKADCMIHKVIWLRLTKFRICTIWTNEVGPGAQRGWSRRLQQGKNRGGFLFDCITNRHTLNSCLYGFLVDNCSYHAPSIGKFTTGHRCSRPLRPARGQLALHKHHQLDRHPAKELHPGHIIPAPEAITAAETLTWIPQARIPVAPPDKQTFITTILGPCRRRREGPKKPWLVNRCLEAAL